MAESLTGNYCKRCKLLAEFCSCDRDTPPPRSYEVFADTVLAEALATVEWHRACGQGEMHIGTPQMQLSTAHRIVRTARNAGILEWHKRTR